MELSRLIAQKRVAQKMYESRMKESMEVTRDELESEIKAKAREVMMSPSFGYPEDEAEDYLFVEVTDGKDYYGEPCYDIEVRAEVSYEGLEELCDALNPVVAKYDPRAYFEPVTSGIIEAYVYK